MQSLSAINLKSGISANEYAYFDWNKCHKTLKMFGHLVKDRGLELVMKPFYAFYLLTRVVSSGWDCFFFVNWFLDMVKEM